MLQQVVDVSRIPEVIADDIALMKFHNIDLTVSLPG